MDNPSLRQEARYEPAKVIPLKQEGSLIDWLKATNRFIPREKQLVDNLPEDDEDFYLDTDDTDYDDVVDIDEDDSLEEDI